MTSTDRQYRLKLHPLVIDRFRSYACIVVYARNLNNHVRDPKATARLQDAVNRARAQRELHPYIAGWRDIYRQRGANPKRYLCSVDALTTRAAKDGVPSVNSVVDIYNAVSLDYTLCIGGEDWDQLHGDLELRFASGDEPFDTRRNGEVVIDHPDPGEVVWCDSSGVTCRRWNWRQCVRTSISETTRNAYFVFDVLPPHTIAHATRAANDLISGMTEFSPDLSSSIEVLPPTRTFHYSA